MRIVFVALIGVVIWTGRSLILRNEVGDSMSATQVARYYERTTPMRDVVCTTNSTNGWKYSCSYTSQNGDRLKIGADVRHTVGGPVPAGSGAVPASDPLPPDS
jgi:hypothetical protein